MKYNQAKEVYKDCGVTHENVTTNQDYAFKHRELARYKLRTAGVSVMDIAMFEHHVFGLPNSISRVKHSLSKFNK
jgi:hypothetical protein